MSAIETLICHTEMKLIGSTSFGFAQSILFNFQNTVYELIVALSLTLSQTSPGFNVSAVQGF